MFTINLCYNIDDLMLIIYLIHSYNPINPTWESHVQRHLATRIGLAQGLRFPGEAGEDLLGPMGP